MLLANVKEIMMSVRQVRRPLDEVLSAIQVISDERVAYLRSLTFGQKLQMIGELNRRVRQQVADRLQTQHPKWTNQQVQAEVARKFLNESDEHLLKFVA